MATPTKNKTNFKTYEASTRLLAAVLATNQVKLDYAELARHVGGGASKDAINHRLRPIKQLAKMQATCVKNGEDPGELPCDKGEIQKLFGESTPAGIEWQFRDVKALGKAQKEAVKNGENPAALPVAGTPGGRKKGPSAASTPGTGARGRKRNVTAASLPPVDSSDDNGSDGDVESPSKRRAAKKARTTPASVTPKAAVNGLATRVATPSTVTPTKAPPTVTPNGSATPRAVSSTSIFGNGASLSSNSFSHRLDEINGQYHAPSPRPAAAPVSIKKEFTTSANPFLGAATATAFDDNDHFQEGEV